MQDCPICSLDGQHVVWKKLQGKPDASMQDKTGFGCLVYLKLGTGMTISGDYGVYTTAVKSIELTDEGIKITTKNSVYLLEIANQ